MNGKLIVIEGLDGSGKATQAKLLAEYLSAKQISFPDYDSQSSALVKMYLNGEIGSLSEVNVYAASSFYAMDRYISFVNKWKQDYEKGLTIIADRYSTSNLCHQMGKLPKDEWDKFIFWLNDYEFNLLKLPKPDTVIYLDMHPETSRKLIYSRYNGDESKMDMHEKDLEYLKHCRESALYASKACLWKVIKCNNDDYSPRTIEDIHKEIIKNIYKNTASK